MNTWKVANPTEETKKELMAATRGLRGSDNLYFISYIDGEIKSSIWLSKDSFVSNPPKDTYQFSIKFDKFYSYTQLEEDLTESIIIAQSQIDYEMEGKTSFAKEVQEYSIDALMDYPYQCSESKALRWKEASDMIVLSSYSDDVLKCNFGYSEERIKELRLNALVNNL